jgi:hypothetical protein
VRRFRWNCPNRICTECNGKLRFLLDRFQVPIWFYQICEKINPSNCDIANAKILISNDIDAFDDFPTQVPSTTVATTVGSVLANNGTGADSLNGIAVTSANTVTITTGP